MNGSVASGGFAEEIISLTRRPSGKVGAASPRWVRGSSWAGAAAPRPAQPPPRPERKPGVAAAGGTAVAGTGAAEGGSRRRGWKRSAQRCRAQGLSMEIAVADTLLREKLVPCVRESWLGQSPSSAGAPVEAGVCRQLASGFPWKLPSPVELLLPSEAAAAERPAALDALRVRGRLKIMCPSGRPLCSQLGVHCAAYLEVLWGV